MTLKPPEDSPTPRSPIDWIFSPNPLGVHLAAAGIVAAEIIKGFVGSVPAIPSAGANALISLLFFFVLVLPPALQYRSPNSLLCIPTLLLGIGYGFMVLLYLLKWTVLSTVPGYEPLSDLVSTLFFVAAWYMLTRADSDYSGRIADQTAVVALGLVVTLAGLSKAHIEYTHSGVSPVAVRLILNFCNGAILLSLYYLLRRLFQSPDPLTHLVILLFGCAQIAAHGRDCITVDPPLCALSSVDGIVAATLAWILFLGKVGFGLYIFYLYFNASAARANERSAAIVPRSELTR